MTMCAVYIGDLTASPFEWEGGDWNDNCPKRLSPEFPPIWGNYNRKYHV
jgi:hypothetical protein